MLNSCASSLRTTSSPLKQFWEESTEPLRNIRIPEYSRQKRELHLHLSFPYVNSFTLSPNEVGRKTNTGFWGLGLGGDYFYRDKQFLNLSAAAVTDFFLPVPAAVDLFGFHESMSSIYTGLSNNYKIGCFSLGYGISFSRNTWSLTDHGGMLIEENPTKVPARKSLNTLGLVFPAYLYLGDNVSCGIVYRPSFYRPNAIDKIKYEHLISLDFVLKIRVLK